MDKEELEASTVLFKELNTDLVKFINSLSIREITNITTDIDKQISDEEFQTLPTGEHFKTKQPILYFLAVLKRMNILCETGNIISYLESTKQSLQMLRGYLLMDRQMTYGQLFYFHGGTYQVKKIIHKNFIDIDMPFVTPSILINTLKEQYVEKAISNAVTICTRFIK